MRWSGGWKEEEYNMDEIPAIDEMIPDIGHCLYCGNNYLEVAIEDGGAQVRCVFCLGAGPRIPEIGELYRYTDNELIREAILAWKSRATVEGDKGRWGNTKGARVLKRDGDEVKAIRWYRGGKLEEAAGKWDDREPYKFMEDGVTPNK